MNFKFFICFLLIPLTAIASPNYHLVGWLNTFVPGGGQFLLGNGWQGAAQAGIEISTFGVGYALSARTSLTLDGVPEDYPAVNTRLGSRTTLNKVCVQYNTLHQCTKYALKPAKSSYYTFDNTPVDFSKPIAAAILQEVGIKYHMVNVFEAYRSAYSLHPDEGGQGIDTRPTIDLFKDPFKWDTVSSPWVWIPLLMVLGITGYDYASQVSNGVPTIQPLTNFSNISVGFNQLGLYPVGSGAPEEMFYRGFLQNEAFHLVNSPFFAIPLSTAAFSFSHGPDGRIGAAVTGSYLGFLAYKNNGNLSEGIALHFWSVVVLGLESLLLTLRSEHQVPPVGTQFMFMF